MKQEDEAMAEVDEAQRTGVEPAETALEVVGGERQAAAKRPARRDGEDAAGASAGGLNAVMNIPVSIEIVLGRARMPLSRLMQLGRGAIIQLDRRVGEQVDVVVNDRVVARGEVVILDEDQTRFGVSLTSVVGATEVEENEG